MAQWLNLSVISFYYIFPEIFVLYLLYFCQLLVYYMISTLLALFEALLDVQVVVLCTIIITPRIFLRTSLFGGYGSIKVLRPSFRTKKHLADENVTHVIVRSRGQSNLWSSYLSWYNNITIDHAPKCSTVVSTVSDPSFDR